MLLFTSSNSTSTLQRKVVFKKDMDGIIDIAVEGAKLIKELTDNYDGDTNIRFEYSPESSLVAQKWTMQLKSVKRLRMNLNVHLKILLYLNLP